MKLLLLLAFVASAYSAYFEPGEHSCDADIVFMLDTSGSISSAQYTQMINFVASFVSQVTLGPSSTQIGVVTFASTAMHRIDLNQYGVGQEAALEAAIIGMTRYSGGTYMTGGINTAKDISFTVAKGDRKPDTNYPNVAILMTDGAPNNLASATAAGAALRATGATMVGIGLDVSATYLARIQQVVGATSSVFDVGFADLINSLNAILDAVCPVRTKQCHLEKGVLVNTYDGLNLQIYEETKTHISSWETNLVNPCKFRIRAVTSFDCFWDPPYEFLPLFLDWVGVNVDKHPSNQNKNRWSYLLTQDRDKVTRRGHGGVRYYPLPNDGDYFTNTFSDGKKLKITKRVDGSYVRYELRTECDYAVDWKPGNPNWREGELDIYIRNTLGGEMRGLCQDANGNAPDDWQTCDRVPVTPGPDGAEEIAENCIDGRWDGQGVPGCTKSQK